MKFSPEKYKIADEPMVPYLDAEEIWSYLNNANPTTRTIEKIVAKSLNKERLNLEEVATLVNADKPEQIEIIKKGHVYLRKKFMVNALCFLHHCMLVIFVRITANTVVSKQLTRIP